MTAELETIHQLKRSAEQQYCRFGMKVTGSLQWQQVLCHSTIQSWPAEEHIFCFGWDGGQRCTNLTTGQGQQVLGQECHLLIWNLSSAWDANSFSSAIGTLSGGGLLILVGELQESVATNQWLNHHISKLLVMTPVSIPALPSLAPTDTKDSFFVEQQEAISAIQRVVTGHRKRPLILTADRGRGKTSALGIASAQLMSQTAVTIIVTAPSKRALQPLYAHLRSHLPDVTQEKDTMYFATASLRFVALEQLLRNKERADLVLVDEAAAFPVPMLQSLVEDYHRVVFSTTINGYEGCGRGFTLTFQRWLMSHRPGTHHLHISQPIRWQKHDPLEAWYRDMLLLNHRLPSLSAHQPYTVSELYPQQLVAEPGLLQQLFTLLVSAHYQTSPNDVFQILNDDAVRIVVARSSDDIVGCVLAIQEGELDSQLIQDICVGKRRPRGQLGAVTLANQIGVVSAAQQSSLRVMRIAVHPDVQKQGIGRALLEFLDAHANVDYLSTSFGCTLSLLAFWKSCGFVCIKLGAKRDQASGCHSAFMVRTNSCCVWLDDAVNQFRTQLSFELNDTFRHTDADILQLLLADAHHSVVLSASPLSLSIVDYYAQGGSNYESVAANIYQLILLRLQRRLAVSPLLFNKVVQKWSWRECASQYHLAGKKQVEQRLRQEIMSWMSDLHCK